MEGPERHIALDLLTDAVHDGGQKTRLQVRGTCMHPLVQDGDWVQVRPLRGLPRRGQLVLARDTRDQLVCHRIIAREDGGFRLAGDRSFAVEEHRRESILGEVIAVERRGRHLQLHPDTAPGRWLDPLLAACHGVTHRHRHRAWGRWLESLRWRLVVCRHRCLWWLA